MAKIKYNIELMKFISVVESLTGAQVKDCIPNEPLLFIIHENQMGKAIGKRGANLKKVESVLKKKVQFIEYKDDLATFVKSYLSPITVDVEVAAETMIIHAKDAKTRGKVFGRDKKNLEQLKDIVTRFYDVTEVKVE